MNDKEWSKIEVRLVGNIKYDGEIVAYAFSKEGRLLARETVRGDDVSLPLPPDSLRRATLLFGPPVDDDQMEPTPGSLRRLNAFAAVLDPMADVPTVTIPDSIVNFWPVCLCWVTGRVLKDGYPVCNAQVHICDVDRRYWIQVLPVPDLLRLRDALLDILGEPFPPVIPEPPIPLPDPPPFIPRIDLGQPLIISEGAALSGIREARRGSVAAQMPTAISALRFKKSANKAELSKAVSKPAIELIDASTVRKLISASASVVREALLADYQILFPYLCLHPIWWYYTCDELGVVTTDTNGRFGLLVPYSCDGDKPDIYFWVEYELGGVLQTVYRPPMPCNTWWNYACGTEITINIRDSRVPVCDPEPDPEGCLVAVKSIGRKVSIAELQTGGANEGQTLQGEPLGGQLEPRVDFSRSELIAKGITHYRWSMMRLTGPDGLTPAVTAWQVLDDTVYRHYRVFQSGVLSYPSDELGPDPAGPVSNSFRIKPASPPAPGTEWVTLNERVDLASAYFRTRDLPGAPATRTDGDDTSAGKYALKLELFKTGSPTPIVFEDEGVALKIPTSTAPFPEGPVPTTDAPAVNRIFNDAGKTVAFQMVIRVDNNFCEAQVLPATGTTSTCGVMAAGPADNITLGFLARHPNRFSTYSFTIERGDGTDISASFGSSTGAPMGYIEGPDFEYRDSFQASSLLGPTCPQAAFAERIHVDATATDGYATLQAYDASDLGAFALTTP